MRAKLAAYVVEVEQFAKQLEDEQLYALFGMWPISVLGFYLGVPTWGFIFGHVTVYLALRYFGLPTPVVEPLQD